MATPNATPEASEIVSEIQIAAPPDRVFDALVVSSEVVKWWGQKGIYICKEFQADLRVGGIWRSAGVDGRGNPFEINGKFLEIDRPKVLAYTWVASWTGDLETAVRWELESVSGGTQARIRHSGFTGRMEMEQNYRGWPRMLGWLQALLERGEIVKDRALASWR